MGTYAYGADLKVAIENHRLTLAIVQLALCNATLEAERAQIDELIHQLTSELGSLQAACPADRCATAGQSRNIRSFLAGLTHRWDALAASLDCDRHEATRLVRALRTWERRHSRFEPPPT